MMLLTLVYHLINCLPEQLLAAMRDRASVNDVALRTLKIVDPKVTQCWLFLSYIRPRRREA